MSLRLFYWDDVEALAQWAPGRAFALAHSKEEAIDLVVDMRGGDQDERDALRTDLVDHEPEVFTEPVGFGIVGSA